MNQYYGNNEMEVLDLKMGRSMYPYAQNSRSELQSMDYKEWLHMCERNDGLYPGTLASTKDIITTSLDIVGTILGFIPIVGGPISAGVSILSSVIGLLWPEPTPEEPQIDPQAIWIQFMEKVEVLIDQEIAKEAYNAAIGRLTGLKRALNLYQVAFELWVQDPTDPELKETLRIEFLNARSEMVSTIETFRYTGQEINLLTVFAQAADLHLLLLREGIMYGVQWGFDERTVESFYSNSQGEGLKDLLPQYTDYCTYWYNEGLQITYTLKPDLSDTERYPWATGKPDWNQRVLEELEGWNLFNDWRRDVTIMALDLVALWPTYDLGYYNNLEYGVTTELTRPVYSRASGTSWGSILTRDQYEQGIVRSPHLVTWLNSVDFHLNPGPFNASNSYKHYTGLKMKYYYSGLDYTIYESPLIGATSYSKKTINVEAKYNNDMFQADVKHDDAVYTMDFFKNNGNIEKIGYPRDPNYSTLSWPPETNISNYDHQMTWISGPAVNNTIPAFGIEWVHNSSSPFNYIAESTIENPIITQMPAVKAETLNGNASVIKGPGSTGGDLVSVSPGASVVIRLTGTTQPAYQVRLRYVSQGAGQLWMSRDFYQDGGWGNNYATPFDVPATTSDESLTYNSFDYVVAPGQITYPSSTDWRMTFYNSGKTIIIMDKIEFIPIQENVAEYEAQQNLEKAWKAVNALFTNDTKNALRLDITDYDVDQAANKVDCMSDDIFTKEKMILLDQVKQAKRLSQARNLLNVGDFESPDWSDENGWKVSNNVTVQSDYPISRGRYLNMPGARVIEFSDTLYPTYAYQKIDESQLKPYTRYLVRGFVESSKKLELLVTRYGKDIYTEMNVPSYQVINSQGVRMLNSCGTKQVSSYTIPPTMPSDPCQNVYATNTSSLMIPSTNGLCEDKQHFLFHVDVGELDMRANPGIEFGLKLSSPEGMAKLDNLEVIEANPLTGEALARVKKREQKWRKEMKQKCALTEKAVTSATQAVDSLFTNTQKVKLKSTTNMQSIENAEAKVDAIPYIHHPEFEDLSGMNTMIFQQLQSTIMTAMNLYGRRNVIRNGDFSGGLSNWSVTDGVDVEVKDGKFPVLVISQWDANVSQDVCVQPEHGYVLRVTARKEGAGKGYVTISDCTEENTETITFTSNERFMTERSPVTVPTSAVCDITDSYGTGTSPYNQNTMGNGYAESLDRISCSCGNGSEPCTCGSNMRNNLSGRNGTKSYTSTQRIPNRDASLPSAYITKTIEMFPETNRIRIEIGETQGTFLVESIELVCMEE
ncbi:insecticidal delta-endotoxin Cry8Ea1 family protein [Bacillus mycoides]|uniref:insecticidal delta-endotoxin Cry8Ea1 family protein n=1 Tax=Bacillus mycoides TaxID=1405 RepID=UPI002E1A618A|nr:insecticidal delta-endotoxin Cry8Ea1 family protein [Bacillus mycoides]MED1406098.1 insecticidal delta-endotoxin Cry8Ea1 family protein [Bacillus mycoides]